MILTAALKFALDVTYHAERFERGATTRISKAFSLLGGSVSPDWELFSVRDHLRRRLGWDHVPFLVDTDANLSPLAEYTWRAARPGGDRDYENVICLDCPTAWAPD
jgi:hypothetical protein